MLVEARSKELAKRDPKPGDAWETALEKIVVTGAKGKYIYHDRLLKNFNYPVQRGERMHRNHFKVFATYAEYRGICNE